MLIDQDHFQLITEGISPIADGEDRIYYIEARSYFDNFAFRNFSIKITLRENVLYETDNRKYEITPKNYLLAPRQPGKMIIESTFVTRCVCIDLSKRTLQKTIHSLVDKGDLPAGKINANYFFSPDFFENAYPLKDNNLGIMLSNFIADLLINPIRISENIFQNLAREVIMHEFYNLQYLNRLKVKKLGTKHYQLSSLLKARFFMNTHYLRNPGIPEIAAYCNMSDSYFSRNFKQAFIITPDEYIMSKRLEYARKLLLTLNSLKRIAGICGFSDVFTFSKAFKKMYGRSPSKYQESRQQSPNTTGNK